MAVRNAQRDRDSRDYLIMGKPLKPEQRECIEKGGYTVGYFRASFRGERIPPVGKAADQAAYEKGFYAGFDDFMKRAEK
jgi:hypothetical protein